MAYTGPLIASVPPQLVLDPRLTAADVDWLNGQLGLVDEPSVRFTRALPPPPPPSGGYRRRLPTPERPR